MKVCKSCGNTYCQKTCKRRQQQEKEEIEWFSNYNLEQFNKRQKTEIVKYPAPFYIP